jgi:hypothetical protein
MLVPFVRRWDLRHNHFLLIRGCFVLGSMEEEAMKDFDETKEEDLWFW